MQLDTDFESALREEVLDQAHEALQASDSVVDEAIQRSEAQLRAVASREGYEIESVLDSLDGPTIQRGEGSIRVSWGWTHEAAEYMEWGTADHSIEGNPILSFVWEDAPEGVAQMFPETFPRVFFSEVEVSGIEESRYNREGVESLRHELRQEGL